MSRIGKSPITLPKEVTVAIEGRSVQVKGPKGQLTLDVPGAVSVKETDHIVTVECHRNDKAARALHGFIRAEIANMAKGVTQGWAKTLELSGVGYRATMAGANLVLSVGFSHQVTIVPPAGISFAVVEGKVVVSGIDKQAVGQAAADIRGIKKPEPYKGKGIKYQGEHIRKKAGKSAKAIGGAGGGK